MNNQNDISSLYTLIGFIVGVFGFVLGIYGIACTLITSKTKHNFLWVIFVIIVCSSILIIGYILFNKFTSQYPTGNNEILPTRIQPTFTPTIKPTNSQSLPSRIEFQLLDEITIIFTEIQPDTFIMGSPDDEIDKKDTDNDELLHRVSITQSFWISIYEVTNEQYLCFDQKHSSGEHYDDPKQPVVNVTWDNAFSFCEWISNYLGKNINLPTEAQWEYACRAETTERRYWKEDSGSLQTCKYANVADMSYKKLRNNITNYFKCNDQYMFTAPVGQFLPNKYGLYDMQGNVYEWCLDYYRKYPDLDQVDPKGPTEGSKRVLRGGSFTSAAGDIRSADRFSKTPNYKKETVGFRVVLIP